MSELRPSNVLEQLAGYVLDDLLPQAAAEVEQILHNEPSLMLEVKRLQEAFALLPYALSEVKPPLHLCQTILEAIIPPN